MPDNLTLYIFAVNAYRNGYLYQFNLILAQFEGVNLTLTALKISHLEQLNSKIFA
ncbi:hypothetical protein PPEP_a1996 [Pseudoalteromonas peptidolytica F12-50-A1]|uniref:Uncharacterized protein n=1 Tax=Pseudoalteromonas peptidolytica F12-50-A1 TaxID=1315280 RepID=A0A8I0MX59_9GAMM|nr:hypothetical protein [Pseudoalteromonas peptidolytica F12-50-A1]